MIGYTRLETTSIFSLFVRDGMERPFLIILLSISEIEDLAECRQPDSDRAI